MNSSTNFNSTSKQSPEIENRIPSAAVFIPVTQAIPKSIVPIVVSSKTNNVNELTIFTDSIQIQEIPIGQKMESVKV